MKTALLFASFLAVSALFLQGTANAQATERYQYRSRRVINDRGTTVEGIIPRIAAAPNPLQMINPFAPPSYGSGRNFVVYTDEWKLTNRDDTQNKARFQPEALRFLTLRPFP